jgi:Vitamin B12 dependent methionine synthase, activation domain
MHQIIDISSGEIVPTVPAVLQAQGIPANKIPEERIVDLAKQSISLLQEISRPKGIMMEISTNDFSSIYFGEGKNEIPSPLETIYPYSDNLAVFAVTLGEDVDRQIAALFEKNEFPLGSMLDSAASEGAERAADILETYFAGDLKKTGQFPSSSGLLRFSPGYCGWHVSAQRKLFSFLRPEQIGITLRDSFLMQPLKSISGVAVAATKELFLFDDDFSFCADCKTHSCRNRISAPKKIIPFE